ncbi:PASTA domain-containing protein [Nocardioides stalactiti]|uniref:PASTA domain-containing protein n=1 Tax=Nocardioides stalactiti TaxID=2755356 RepID=UPI0016021016|nr:PASTA domain-containing protein [Nocardioides stalactiti]
MTRWRGAWAGMAAAAAVASGCGAEPDVATRAVEPTSPPVPSSAVSSPPSTSTDLGVVMPDLVGLPDEVAGIRLRQGERASLDLGLELARPVLVSDCSVPPETIVTQRPAAGTLLAKGQDVVLRSAQLDLAVFRGPCSPADGDLGPVTGPDAALARAFYRFAADPSLGAPFGDGPLWVGIEGGPTSAMISPEDRSSLAAWSLDALYAESSGPFSALDLVASTGGRFEVHDGIPGCFTGDGVPAELADLRPISITRDADLVGACLDWWAVTLFVDEDDRIRGVALRMGSP